MSQSTLTVIRRVIVVTGLLCLPSLCEWLHGMGVYEWRKSSFAVIIAYFANGVHGVEDVLLAIWFVSRRRLWDSWQGWLRALVYAAAAFAGSLLGTMVENWVREIDQNLFGRLLFDSLSILSLIWLFMPIRLLIGRVLADAETISTTTRTFSIRWLLLWNAIAACYLAFLRILTVHRNVFSLYLDETAAGFELLFGLVQLLAVCVIMIGLAGSWYHLIVAMIAGTLILVEGTQLTLAIWSRLEPGWFVFPQFDRVWSSYYAGYLIAPVVVFALARDCGSRGCLETW